LSGPFFPDAGSLFPEHQRHDWAEYGRPLFQEESRKSSLYRLQKSSSLPSPLLQAGSSWKVNMNVCDAHA
jgi:hypothetical protein